MAISISIFILVVLQRRQQLFSFCLAPFILYAKRFFFLCVTQRDTRLFIQRKRSHFTRCLRHFDLVLQKDKIRVMRTAF